MSDIISIQQRVEQRARREAHQALNLALDKFMDTVNGMAYPSTGYGYCRPLVMKIQDYTVTATVSDMRYKLAEAIMSAFEKDISSRATDAFLKQVDKLQSDLDALNDSVRQ